MARFFFELFVLLTISIIAIRSNPNNCSVVQRRVASILENTTTSDDESRNSGTSNRRYSEDLPMLCPSMASNKGLENGSCCAPPVQHRLLERSLLDLTEWTLETANSRMALVLNQTLDHLRTLVRSHLATTERRLHQMFEENFPQAAVPVRSAVDQFFKTLLNLLITGRVSPDIDESVDEGVQRIVSAFFAQLFPPVYACVWVEKCHERGYALSRNYSNCLVDHFDSIEPFNDVPRQLATKLAWASRGLVSGLRFLSELLAFVDPNQKPMWQRVWRWAKLDDQRLDPCKLAVFQLTYCPLCSGHDARITPCRDACQSAVQLCVEQQMQNGPLVRIDNRLNAAWRTFERRMRHADSPNPLILEDLLDGIRFDIQDVIASQFFEDGASMISEKVVDFCGPMQSVAEEKAVANGRQEKKRQFKHKQHAANSEDKMQIRSTPLDVRVTVAAVLASIAQNLSGSFTDQFGRRRLAETICSIKSTGDSRCWNPSRYAQTMSTMGSSAGPGLEKTVAHADSKSDGQQADLEARLKRITDTLERARGPDFETSESNGQSERLVAADRPPSYHATAGQQQFMVRNDEIMSSGDGAMEDDEDDEENGDFGSGDMPDVLEADPVPGTGDGRPQPTRATEGVYIENVDTTGKPGPTTTPRRARPPNAGATRKSYVESEDRHPTTQKSGSSSFLSPYRTLSLSSSLLRLLLSFIIGSILCRTLVALEPSRRSFIGC